MSISRIRFEMSLRYVLEGHHRDSLDNHSKTSQEDQQVT